VKGAVLAARTDWGRMARDPKSQRCNMSEKITGDILESYLKWRYFPVQKTLTAVRHGRGRACNQSALRRLSRRAIIRALVKRTTVGQDDIRIVYRVSPTPFVDSPEKGHLETLWVP